ncbi:MAG: GreA/GreB family elongation factor [Rhodospirillaceae bacterium]
MTHRPHIWIQQSDYRRLSTLAGAAPEAESGVGLLAEELARAIVLRSEELPPAVVRLGDRVLFRRDEDWSLEWGELVLPDESGQRVGCISVTSPLGAALIGLRAGARMTYTDAAGCSRCLVIERVLGGAGL